MRQADLNHLKMWFQEYVAQFCELPEEELRPISLKVQHTERTCEDIILIGRENGLAEQDLFLAETTALFHDVGRFLQWQDYRTFIDSESRDHALLGLEVLSRHRVLMRLSSKEQEVINEAVRVHNHRKLPTRLSSRQLLFARLLRDADKLDIWRVICSQQQEHRTLMEALSGDLPIRASYSRELVGQLRQGRIPDFGSVQSQKDLLLLRLGWVFDLNFGPSYRQVLKRKYVEHLCSQLPSNSEIEELQDYLISYLEERSRAE